MSDARIISRDGIAISPEREAWAQRQVKLLGEMAEPHLEMYALDLARRGWPSWRIAEQFGLNRQLIEALGGPPL